MAEKTEGRIKIKVYPGTSLVSGDQTKEFTALRQGIIDMAVGSTINWSPQVKELNLFALPFLMPDHKAIDALTQGRVGTKMFEILAEHGGELVFVLVLLCRGGHRQAECGRSGETGDEGGEAAFLHETSPFSWF